MTEESFRQEGTVFVQSFAPIVLLVERWLVANNLEQPVE